MKILVQKFGGTSVSSEERRKLVADKILKAKEKGYSPVIVVSAMGRKGEPYATDTLLSLLEDRFKEENPLCTDLLLSCGEIISTVVMCNELMKHNINCIPLTGGQAGIITNANFSNAELIKVNTNRLYSIINEGKIPVIAGFQGSTEDGYITTLGRGGSDVSASIIGAALKAEGIEIYKDVDGIMTADPRIVSDASLIKEISYSEVFQFADQGAKVIHPRAVEFAMKANIPLIIKNTMNNCNGTIINNEGENNSSNIITGITHLSNRVQVTVSINDNIDNSNYYYLLDILAKNEISIDLINVFPSQNIFTIDEKDLEKFNIVMNSSEIKYSCIKDCSKIAIIGSRMRGIPGVMAKILNTLSEENIEILQTADSHTTIWCLVNSANTEKAINALHRKFNLG
jgi:aspartate kinase